MLPRRQRLTSSREFEIVYKRGKGYVDRLLVLRILKRQATEPARFGFSTSPKIGTAVARNRAKRRIREAVRLLRSNLKDTGFDAVLIARPAMKDAAFLDIIASAEDLFRKAGVLRKTEQA